MSTDTTPELSPEQLAEIERNFDPETAFRPHWQDDWFFNCSYIGVDVSLSFLCIWLWPCT